MASLSTEVQEAFHTLPQRYLGAEAGFDATYHVVLGDVGHTWEIRCTTHGARVRMGATNRRPDVTIGTDATTWCRLRQGELSGIEAFSQRLPHPPGGAGRRGGLWRERGLPRPPPPPPGGGGAGGGWARPGPGRGPAPRRCCASA